MKISGQCHCGKINYIAEIDLEKVGICHCGDCQMLSASAFRTIAIAPAESFEITKGRPKEYVKTGDSGNRRVQAFCSECGSGIYAADADRPPKAYNIRTGTIDQKSNLVPKFECWCQSAVKWLPENNHTRKFDQNPS